MKVIDAKAYGLMTPRGFSEIQYVQLDHLNRIWIQTIHPGIMFNPETVHTAALTIRWQLTQRGWRLFLLGEEESFETIGGPGCYFPDAGTVAAAADRAIWHLKNHPEKETHHG